MTAARPLREIAVGPISGSIEHPRALRVLLLDRNEIGRGIAYASRPYPYLLNVPAGCMSATSADPLDFLTLIERDLPLVTAHDFVPRELYGDYLKWRLARADAASPSHVRLIRIQGSATAISRLCALAPTLWRELPECERRRFLRHVRVYWDAHRHRLPPPTWGAIEELRKSGTLHVHAGRLIAMQIAGKQIRVRWRPRGERTEKMLEVGRVINCTGPDYDLRNTPNRLLHSLFTRGLAVPDPLGFGLLTDEFGALRGASGRAVRDLYHIGPLACADQGDAIEIQDLRARAEHLARHLAARRPSS